VGAQRRETPPYTRCQGSIVVCALRTAIVVYFRCTECGEVWSVAKPDVEGV
jgi:hypothetical protein